MTTPSSRVPSIPRPPPSPLRTTPAAALPIRSVSGSPSSSSATTSSAAAAARRQTASPTPPPGQKTRARDLLRKHYGLGVGPPPPRPGNTQDPMDLSEYLRYAIIRGETISASDSSAFDAKSYYEQLITTSSLPSLLKRENELLTGQLWSNFSSIND